LKLKPSTNDPDIEIRPPVKLLNGAVYEGEWRISTDKQEGICKTIFPDGSIFEGTMRNGKANGFGRHIKPDGEYYSGQWANDCVEGFGKLVNAAGSSYEGQW
jgi:hypothetical protein